MRDSDQNKELFPWKIVWIWLMIFTMRGEIVILRLLQIITKTKLSILIEKLNLTTPYN